jgi:hypothetical protein
LKEDDFKTLSDYKQWRCYQYYDERIARIRTRADEAIAGIEEDRKPLLAELKYADQIKSEFELSEDTGLDIGSVMKDLAGGVSKGLSKEMLLRMLELVSEEE